MKKGGVKHHSPVSSVSAPEWTVVSSYELEPREEAPVWGMSSSTFAAWELQAMSSTRLKCWESSNNETAERLGGGTVEKCGGFHHREFRRLLRKGPATWLPYDCRTIGGRTGRGSGRKRWEGAWNGMGGSCSR